MQDGKRVVNQVVVLNPSPTFVKYSAGFVSEHPDDKKSVVKDDKVYRLCACETVCLYC